jgi:hypothetical protein
MIAIKATYDGGNLRWVDEPKLAGQHNVLVVFENVDDGLDVDVAEVGPDVSTREQAIKTLQRMYSDIPSDVSLVKELISERRREAVNE